MKKTILTLIISLSAITCYGVQSMVDDNHIEHFTDENGLPQNSVKGLAIGDMGFVWIITEGGLVRFDGRRMINFDKHRLKNSSSRFSDMVKHPVNSGLYAIDEQHLLARIKSGTASIDRQYFSKNRLDSSLLAPLWSNENKYKIKADTVMMANGWHPYKIISGLKGNYYVYIDRKIAFVSGSKLNSIVNFAGDPDFENMPFEPDRKTKLIAKVGTKTSSANFFSIDGALFYHLHGQGLEVLKVSNIGQTKLLLKGDIQHDPAYQKEANRVRFIQNPAQNQCFAFLNKNLYLVSYSARSELLETRLLIRGFDVEENLISSILYSHWDNTIFLGSISRGFFVVRPMIFRTLRDSTNPDFHNVFYAQVPFASSAVIIPDGLILGTHRGTRKKNWEMYENGPPDRLTLLKDHQGNLWIKNEHKVITLNSNGTRQIASWQFKDLPERLYEDSKKRIWIGFANGKIVLLSKTSKQLQPKLLADVGDKINYLQYDAAGRLWIGTTNGLFVFDEKSKKTSFIKGLHGKNVRSIYAPEADQAWITTYGDGIFLVSGNRLHKMPLDRDQYLNYAHCIMEDGQGKFWISTNKGMFRTSRADMTRYAKGRLQQILYIYYDKNSGFLTNEFNGGCQPCAVKLDDGHFSFPSMNGLVWFKPKEIPMPWLNSPFIFEDFVVDGIPVSVSDTVFLPATYQYLSLQVNSAHNGSQANLQFYYSISGNEKTVWTPMPSNQQIDIYGLPYGDHTLLVRKITGFGGSYTERRLILRISKPWFFNWWFIISMTAFIPSLLWLLVQIRVRSLRLQNIRLTQAVADRTDNLLSAVEKQRSLDEALQTQLQIQMRIISVLSHDLHSPLRYLSKNIPKFFEKIEAFLPDQESILYGKAIGKSTEKVYALTDELMAFIKTVYNKNGEIVYEPVNMSEMLVSKANFFLELAAESQTEIIVDVPYTLYVDTNRQMLEIVIHNLVDNALKHTWGSTVTLAASGSASGVKQLSVADSGNGMHTETVNWLNSSPNTSVRVPNNLGLGMIIVKEITHYWASLLK